MSRRKSILLLVTYGCNLRCTYCYEPKRLLHRMTAEQVKGYVVAAVERIGDEFDEFDIQFMGGEPLLEFALIREVTEWLWAQQFAVPLAGVFAPTNGTLLNDEMKAWLHEHRHQITLGLSFDGDRLMQNANRSRSADDVDVAFFTATWPDQSVKMTVSPETVAHLAHGVKHLHGLGFKEIQADLAMGAHVQWRPEHLSIFARQLRELEQFYLAHRDIAPASLLSTRLIDTFNLDGPKKKCGCGESFVCIDHDGTEYACHLFAPITATPGQARASLQIDFTDHGRFADGRCGECLLASVCNICHGMNFLCNGDVAVQSPFTCQAFKVQFLVCCELQLKLALDRGDNERATKIETIIQQIDY